MSLTREIADAQKKIVTDGYEMSFGEIMSLYKDRELQIDPDFQRYFRWEPYQKTRFIESLLLGIPIPPIFVFQTPDGKWELVDGLQRLATVFEFAGILHDPDGKPVAASVLEGTALLPSLDGKTWTAKGPKDHAALPPEQQITIRRARIRVEILKRGSDPLAKFELFQRLNTGGSNLSEQEVRNCIMVQVNKKFYEWLKRLAQTKSFVGVIAQTETAVSRQSDVELALRFFVYREVSYEGKLDVHEYLDSGMLRLATDHSFDIVAQGQLFTKTFQMIQRTLGADAFKRWDGKRFTGKFLMSLYEVIAVGISRNLEALSEMSQHEQRAFVRRRARALWSDASFKRNSGAGVRGTTRLTNLLPLAAAFFKP
jgi:hypothetical protein